MRTERITRPFRDTLRRVARTLAPMLAIALASCGGSRIEGRVVKLTHPIASIAIAPGSDEIGKGVAQGLAESESFGGRVIDSDESASILQQLALPSPKASLPENLPRLREAGIHAWLRLESTNALMGSTPKTVRVRLASTASPDEHVEFLWHNAWGGMPGSPADHMAKVGPFKAGQSIAAELAKILAELPAAPQL